MAFSGSATLDREGTDSYPRRVHQDYTNYLTANRTLSFLSLAYGLPNRIIHTSGPDLALNQKVAADVFEAYVGGVYDDAGSEGLSGWLDSLFKLETWPALAGLIESGLARLERVAPAAGRHSGEPRQSLNLSSASVTKADQLATTTSETLGSARVPRLRRTARRHLSALHAPRHSQRQPVPVARDHDTRYKDCLVRSRNEQARGGSGRPGPYPPPLALYRFVIALKKAVETVSASSASSVAVSLYQYLVGSNRG